MKTTFYASIFALVAAFAFPASSQAQMYKQSCEDCMKACPHNTKILLSCDFGCPSSCTQKKEADPKTKIDCLNSPDSPEVQFLYGDKFQNIDELITQNPAIYGALIVYENSLSQKEKNEYLRNMDLKSFSEAHDLFRSHDRQPGGTMVFHQDAHSRLTASGQAHAFCSFFNRAISSSTINFNKYKALVADEKKANCLPANASDSTSEMYDALATVMSMDSCKLTKAEVSSGGMVRSLTIRKPNAGSNCAVKIPKSIDSEYGDILLSKEGESSPSKLSYISHLNNMTTADWLQGGGALADGFLKQLQAKNDDCAFKKAEKIPDAWLRNTPIESGASGNGLDAK